MPQVTAASGSWFDVDVAAQTSVGTSSPYHSDLATYFWMTEIREAKIKFFGYSGIVKGSRLLFYFEYNLERVKKLSYSQRSYPRRLRTPLMKGTIKYAMW